MMDESRIPHEGGRACARRARRKHAREATRAGGAYHQMRKESRVEARSAPCTAQISRAMLLPGG